MEIRLHEGDLSSLFPEGADLAVDTETLGLHTQRDRLCLVQLSSGDGSADLVRIIPGKPAPNLIAAMTDPKAVKIFHYARFDMAAISHHFGVTPFPVFCTKIASKFARTYTNRHGLREVIRELVGFEISKHQQSSDWGNETLTSEQRAYAAGDVIYLHKVREALSRILQREDRYAFAEKCFNFLPVRVAIDLAGWENEDVFAHHSAPQA